MKCLVCGSEKTKWVKTIMTVKEVGYERYTCSICRGSTEYEFIIKRTIYTGGNNIHPHEKE